MEGVLQVVVLVVLRRALTPVAASALLRMGLGGVAAVCSGLIIIPAEGHEGRRYCP